MVIFSVSNSRVEQRMQQMAAIALMMIYFRYPSPLTKPLPILYLASLYNVLDPATPFTQRYAFPIACGLVLSSIGDVALEVFDGLAYADQGGSPLFLVGLVFFLLAHCFYIYSFYITCYHRILLLQLGPSVAVFYACFMSRLLPGVSKVDGGDLVVPVAGYGVVICSMIFFAANRLVVAGKNQLSSISPTSKKLAFAGAFWFVVSDSVLAINKFVTPIPEGKMIVMITYYLGQLLIAMSTQNQYG
jgi:uncharacterized membrane protein YhhN